MSTNSTVVTTTPASTSATTTTTSLFSSSATTTSSSIASTTTTTSSPSSSSVSTTASSTTTSAPTTHIITSIITQTSSPGDTSVQLTTLTLTTEPSSTAASTTSSASSSSSSSAASLQNSGSSNKSHGLSTSGKVAIAVVIPVVGVALLILAALFFWRRRKQNKAAEEARRKEVEEYGYNPNMAPTIPALAADTRSEMAEDSSVGYRGWGAGRSSNRNPSTTFSGGHNQASDTGSNPGGFSTSPTAFGGSDGQNSDMYPKQRDTMNSDDLGALGAAPVAANNRGDMHRGPSNASSSYTAGHHSDNSDPEMPQHHTSDSLGTQHTYSFNQSSGPYGDGSYGGGDGMPVVRDVSARRNTQIQQGGGYQQGNSGIAQNF